MIVESAEVALAYTYAWWLTGSEQAARSAVLAAVGRPEVPGADPQLRIEILLRRVRSAAVSAPTMCPASELALLHDAIGIGLDSAAGLVHVDAKEARTELAHGRLEALGPEAEFEITQPERLGGLAVGNPADVAAARQNESLRHLREMILTGRDELIDLAQIDVPQDLLDTVARQQEPADRDPDPSVGQGIASEPLEDGWFDGRSDDSNVPVDPVDPVEESDDELDAGDAADLVDADLDAVDLDAVDLDDADLHDVEPELVVPQDVEAHDADLPDLDPGAGDVGDPTADDVHDDVHDDDVVDELPVEQVHDTDELDTEAIRTGSVDADVEPSGLDEPERDELVDAPLADAIADDDEIDVTNVGDAPELGTPGRPRRRTPWGWIAALALIAMLVGLYLWSAGNNTAAVEDSEAADATSVASDPVVEPAQGTEDDEEADAEEPVPSADPNADPSAGPVDPTETESAPLSDFVLTRAGVAVGIGSDPDFDNPTADPFDPISITISYEGAESDDALIAEWTVDGQSFGTERADLTPGLDTTRFTRQVPQAGWPSGQHTLELTLERTGDVVGSAEFLVEGGPTLDEQEASEAAEEA